MGNSKFFVYGGGRWREVDPENGRVSGWGAARFVYVRGGKLVCARRRAVLRGMRALAAGAPTAVRDGPPLPYRRPAKKIKPALPACTCCQTKQLIKSNCSRPDVEKAYSITVTRTNVTQSQPTPPRPPPARPAPRPAPRPALQELSPFTQLRSAVNAVGDVENTRSQLKETNKQLSTIQKHGKRNKKGQFIKSPAARAPPPEPPRPPPPPQSDSSDDFLALSQHKQNQPYINGRRQLRKLPSRDGLPPSTDSVQLLSSDSEGRPGRPRRSYRGRDIKREDEEEGRPAGSAPRPPSGPAAASVTCAQFFGPAPASRRAVTDLRALDPKELVISDSDVAAVRAFLARRGGDAARFDSSEEFRRQLFFRINPLVACRRGPSPKDLFARKLGLRSVARARRSEGESDGDFRRPRLRGRPRAGPQESQESSSGESWDGDTSDRAERALGRREGRPSPPLRPRKEGRLNRSQEKKRSSNVTDVFRSNDRSNSRTPALRPRERPRSAAKSSPPKNEKRDISSPLPESRKERRQRSPKMADSQHKQKRNKELGNLVISKKQLESDSPSLRPRGLNSSKIDKKDITPSPTLRSRKERRLEKKRRRSPDIFISRERSEDNSPTLRPRNTNDINRDRGKINAENPGHNDRGKLTIADNSRSKDRGKAKVTEFRSKDRADGKTTSLASIFVRKEAGSRQMASEHARSGQPPPRHVISKRPCGNAGREYSAAEDAAIAAWLLAGGRASRVNGNRLWRQLQDDFRSLAGRDRSWHSLRNRYLRYILPSLGALALPPADQQRLRAAAATGEIKSKKRPLNRRASIFGRSPPPPSAARAAGPQPGLQGEDRIEEHESPTSERRPLRTSRRTSSPPPERRPTDGASSASSQNTHVSASPTMERRPSRSSSPSRRRRGRSAGEGEGEGAAAQPAARRRRLYNPAAL